MELLDNAKYQFSVNKGVRQVYRQTARKCQSWPQSDHPQSEYLDKSLPTFSKRYLTLFDKNMKRIYTLLTPCSSLTFWLECT